VLHTSPLCLRCSLFATSHYIVDNIPVHLLDFDRIATVICRVHEQLWRCLLLSFCMIGMNHVVWGITVGYIECMHSASGALLSSSFQVAFQIIITLFEKHNTNVD
jgi:hypothetical protein